jgi:uncharacterized protein YcfJ
MKVLPLAVASIFTVLASSAFAQDSYQDRQWSRGRDVARVIESRPLYNTANSHEECWNPRAGVYETVREDDDKHNVLNKGTAIGAVAGGVVGHQVDNSNTGTAIGALLGGLIGNQVDKSRNTDGPQNDLDRSRCRVTSRGDVQGYEVKYSYRGNTYTTRMDHNPSTTLRVGEDIRSDGRPVEPVAWR